MNLSATIGLQVGENKLVNRLDGLVKTAGKTILHKSALEHLLEGAEHVKLSGGGHGSGRVAAHQSTHKKGENKATQTR